MALYATVFGKIFGKFPDIRPVIDTFIFSSTGCRDIGRDIEKSRNLLGIKAMRLSLRTLLAFEDNIFDSEQHRQLERIIPKSDAAAMTLGRIRSVVRNPRLGVPGLVDRREELDPNLIAEYLDHQMSSEIQERFEAYCLSSDKYLAEVASIHQILSNVLGEPARTSRECRLRCYDLYGDAPKLPTFEEKLDSRRASGQEPVANEYENDVPCEKNFNDFLRLFPVSDSSSSPKEFSSPQPERQIFRGDTASSIPFPASGVTVGGAEFRHEIVEERVSETKDKPSLFGTILRLFVPQDDSPEKETKKPDKEGEKKSSGFSFWTLLFLFILGLAALFGWRITHEELRESQATRFTNAIENDRSHPPVSPVVDIVSDTVSKPSAAANPIQPLPQPEPKFALAAIAAPASTTVPLPVEKEKPIPPPTAATSPPIPLPVEEVPKKVEAVTQAPVLTPPPPAISEPPTIKEMAQVPTVLPTEPQTEKTTAEPIDPFDVAAFAPSPIPLETKASSELAADVSETVPPSVSADPFLAAVGTIEPVQTVGWNPDTVKAIEQPPAVLPASDKTKNEIETSPSAISLAESHPMHPGKPTPLRGSGEPANARILESPELEDESVHQRHLLVSTPIGPPEASEPDSIIAFQPISAQPKRRNADLETGEEKKRFETAPIRNRIETTQNDRNEPIRFEKAEVDEVAVLKAKPMPPAPISGPPTASKQTLAIDSVVHPVGMARQFGEVVPVGQILESKRKSLGRIPALPEPSVLFSAPSAGEQWILQSLPMELFADQYLLTITPFRIDVDLGGVFRIEMVGDAKLCILPPNENGVPGIFVDYGRLVIRPNPSADKEAFALRIQTETVEGMMEFKGPKSLAFVDTFAEVLTEPGADMKTRVPKASPIIGFVPDAEETISWQPIDRKTPLSTNRQASVLLKPGNVDFGRIQSLPNWLHRTPLPVEGRTLAETCNRVFKDNAGDSEAALHAMILQESMPVRFFGYRLWGDLGRFDVPLSLLSEAKPEEESLRQVLVPYFREVMKRDEETVQRLADAIEAVRR